MERRNLCLSHLRDTAKEAEALRQENINLHIANIELSNQFNTLLMLQPSSLQNCHVAPTREHETASSAALFSPSLVDDFRGMRITDDESDSENLDVNRVSLPKSTSVRSDGYLKAVQPSGSSSKGYGHVRAPNRIKRVKPVKKVYIRGGEEKPLELQVYDQGMSKTEMCNNWQQTGACRYGDNCYFAHGIEELRPVLRHPRFKAEVCRMVLNGDFCPYGRRCHFRHTLTDEEKLMAQLSNPSRPLRLK